MYRTPGSWHGHATNAPRTFIRRADLAIIAVSKELGQALGVIVAPGSLRNGMIRPKEFRGWLTELLWP